MVITPFKGRTLDINKRVMVYRCLNRKGHVYSIKQGGLVVAHTTEISLRNVGYEVSQSGKMRAQKTNTRNVHAYLKAFVAEDYDHSEFTMPITYNPFNDIGFHIKGTKVEVTASQKVVINDKGVFG